MPPSKDTDELGTDASASLLVDLLYGEFDGDAEVQAQERVRDNAQLHGEYESLLQLRAMMRELPAEEPSQAVTAKLLHAAAIYAPATAGAVEADVAIGSRLGAWIKRYFRPVALYPGLAAATSLLLVASVAGVLYVSGRTDLAGPEVTAQARDSESVMVKSTASDPSSGLSASAGLGKGDKSVAEAPTAAQIEAQIATTGSSSTDEESRNQNIELRQQMQSEKSKRVREQGGAFAPAPATETKAPQKGQSRPGAAGKGSRDRGAGGSPSDAVAIELEQRKLKPILDADEDGADGPKKPPDEDSDTAGQKKANVSSGPYSDDGEAARVQSLHREAQDAARGDDCGSVGRIGQRIRSLDPGYHRDVFLRDKALVKCFRYIDTD
ncbi:MAG: hypothetical protein MJE77_33910 [Proteobacteria bacterium]|nr:hypothetical protein [Pseudomonadota bacterium]